MNPIYCDIYFVLPSAFDILRYILSCRAIAIYDLPINLRYIYKRVSPLIAMLYDVIPQDFRAGRRMNVSKTALSAKHMNPFDLNLFANLFIIPLFFLCLPGEYLKVSRSERPKDKVRRPLARSRGQRPLDF